MNRLTVALGVVALVVGALAGYLGSGLQSRRLQRELQESQSTAARLERELNALRAENERIGAQLKSERARGDMTEADLRREKELNARLYLLVGGGKK